MCVYFKECVVCYGGLEWQDVYQYIVKGGVYDVCDDYENCGQVGNVVDIFGYGYCKRCVE